MRLMGLRIVGELPNEKKILVAAAPHTSNWDFVIALVTILTLGVRAHILMKKEAFIWPFSPLWHWFGFIPTNRQVAGGIVGSVVENFNNSEQLWVAIAPEGTRSANSQWKTGFLRMAHEAQVPILPLSWDYPSKTLYLGQPINTSGNHQQDLEAIRSYFSSFTGKNPHNQA